MSRATHPRLEEIGPLRSSVALTGWCGLILPLLLGCAVEDENVSRMALASRLIEAPNEELFSIDTLRTRQEVHSWPLTGPTAAEWRMSPAELAREVDGRLQLAAVDENETLRLSRSVSLAARDIAVITVEVTGWRRGELRLFWAETGAQFDRDRSIAVAPERRSRGLARQVEIHVGDHPLWRGQIAALRLNVPLVRGESLQLDAIAAHRYRVQPHELAAALARPWRIDLDHDARPAVLTPPGVPYTWDSGEEHRGRLRFALGIPEGVRSPITFRLSSPSATGPHRILFEETIDPQSPAAGGRWLDRSVNLENGAGKRLILETTSTTTYDIHRGIPAWGNPELLSPTRRTRPNVILISIDTLRADRLSLYGYDQPTTPNLERWARRRGMTFTTAVSSAPWTLPSHASMLTGLDALSHGVNHVPPVHDELELLSEILRREGFATLAISGGGWLRPTNGFAQGFDTFRYWPGGTEEGDEVQVGVSTALDLLDRYRDREFFLFFHTYEPHDPYHRRLPYGERCADLSPADGREMLYGATPVKRLEKDGFEQHYRFVKWAKGTAVRQSTPASEQDLERINCYYDSGVAFADAQVGRLLDELASLDLERRTLVILTSDHGESLGEQGLAKHAYLVDTNLLVPLVIAMPGTARSGFVDQQVSSVDIVPTVLDALDVPHDPMDGESLVGLMSGSDNRRHREAWSYAGISNFGISLRLDDQWQYRFNNSAWPPLRGDEQLIPLGDETENESGIDQNNLRRRLREYLSTRTHGVELTVSNQSCADVEGQLEGGSVDISRLKALDGGPGQTLRWLKKHRSAFRVEPGHELTLLLEEARGSLSVSARVEACDESVAVAVAETLQLEDLTSPLELSLTEASDSPARLVLRRRGPARSFAGTEKPPDPEMLEQLRALGYVN